jgi:hypothetical protein
MAGRKKAESEEVQSVQDVQTEFTKGQILNSAKYKHRRDLVDALLKDEKKYTMKSVDGLIDNFLKGQVN